jgi:hypothetical protein
LLVPQCLHFAVGEQHAVHLLLGFSEQPLVSLSLPYSQHCTHCLGSIQRFTALICFGEQNRQLVSVLFLDSESLADEQR